MSVDEYAMINGWDLNVFPKNTWSVAQNQRYMEWAKFAGKVDSDYSNLTSFAGTTYEPPQQTAWSQQNWQPGRNSVVTTNDQAGVRRRANTMDFGAGEEDLPADELLARMRATKTAEVPDQTFEELLDELDAIGTTDIDLQADQEVLDFFDDDLPVGGRPTKVVAPTDVEMQPMGASRPLWEAEADAPFTVGDVEPYTVQPDYTAGQIRPFNNAAEAWEMPNARSINVVSDLEAPLLSAPEITIPELQAMGVPNEELGAALASSFSGLDSFGVPSFDVGSLMGELKGGAGTLAAQWLLGKLKETGRAGEDVSNMVQVVGGLAGLGMMATVGLGPMGWLMGAGQTLYTAGAAFAKQQANITDNDFAGDTADTRMMMVLDSGTWYPAILKNRLKPEGLGSTSNDITVSYGRPEDLQFAYEEGKYRGHFANQKQKQFRMDDSEWSGEKSTFAWADQKDFMRPYYFLSNEESLDIMKDYGTKDFSWKTIEQDTTNYSPVMKDFSEIQNALDYMQNKERKTGDPTSFLTSASKALRKQTNEIFETGIRFFEDATYTDNKAFPQGDEAYGLNTKWDSYKGFGKSGMGTIRKLDNEVIPRWMKVLENTRQLAAGTTGVDWHVYNDFTKDLPIADSLSALKAQNAVIEAYTDRNQYQKQYLQEKAGVRYLMGVTNKFGYGADLFDVMWAGSKRNNTNAQADRRAEVDSGQRQYLSDNDMLPGRYYFDDGNTRISTLKSTPAWLNKGETPLGMMGGLAGWQAEEEAQFQQANSRFRSQVITNVGYDPEDLIQQHGSQMNAINVAKQLVLSVKN